MAELYQGKFSGEEIDSAIEKIQAIQGLPAGGATGQVVTKTDGGAEWADAPGGDDPNALKLNAGVQNITYGETWGVARSEENTGYIKIGNSTTNPRLEAGVKLSNSRATKLDINQSGSARIGVFEADGTSNNYVKVSNNDVTIKGGGSGIGNYSSLSFKPDGEATLSLKTPPTAGQVLTAKDSNGNLGWADAARGLPAGGTNGQILSITDDAGTVGWINPEQAAGAPSIITTFGSGNRFFYVMTTPSQSLLKYTFVDVYTMNKLTINSSYNFTETIPEKVRPTGDGTYRSIILSTDNTEISAYMSGTTMNIDTSKNGKVIPEGTHIMSYMRKAQ